MSYWIPIAASIIGTITLLSGALIIRRWRNRGDDERNKDERHPIVYLRSFRADDDLSDDEISLGRIFVGLGPFIAVGKPGELYPPFGAKRIQLSDSEWQAHVLELLRSAQLVLLATGGTDGLQWELARCREVVEPRRFLILVDSDPLTFETFRRNAVSRFGTDFPKLGVDSRKFFVAGRISGIISFDDSWRPNVTSIDRSTDLVQTERGQIESQLREALRPRLNSIGLRLSQRNSLIGVALNIGDFFLPKIAVLIGILILWFVFRLLGISF